MAAAESSDPVKQAMRDMREYEKTLRDRGDLLQARAAGRCMEILRRAERRHQQKGQGDTCGN